jgi:hypothetical protein
MGRHLTLPLIPVEVYSFSFSGKPGITEVYNDDQGYPAFSQPLNRNDIDWQRNSIKVLGKGNKEREVYLGARARIWLQRHFVQ